MPPSFPPDIQPRLDVRQVGKTYADARVRALDTVSLRVDAGELVALMGPSGCGKSTLLNLMGAIDTPSTGSLILDGVDLATLDDNALTRLRREKIGMVFQFFNLLPTLTVAENIALPLTLSARWQAKALAERVDALLAQVNLSHRRDFYPARLSGGEMQRTAIARALIHDPVLVLADEPTGNLDSENGEQILTLLRDLCQVRGKTLVMATHSDEAARYTHRTIHMRDGAIVQPQTALSE